MSASVHHSSEHIAEGMQARHYIDVPALHQDTSVFKEAVPEAPIRERSDKLWLVKDCCGLFTAIMVYLLIIGPAYFIPFRLMRNWSPYSRWPCSVVFWSVAGLGGWSHLKCMTTNPGTIPLRTARVAYPQQQDTLLLESAGMRYCNKCEGPKSPRAHHCSQCKRCVVKMDHHCPWMNNCVGMHNFKFFMLFLVYIGLMSIMSLTFITVHVTTSPADEAAKALRGYQIPTTGPDIDLIQDYKPLAYNAAEVLTTNESIAIKELKLASVLNRRQKRQQRPRRYKSTDNEELMGLKPLEIVSLVLIGVESLIFGLFTFIMFIDVSTSAGSGGGIENMHKGPKLKHHILANEACAEKDCASGMRELCGGPCGFLWMTPVMGDETYYRKSLTDLDLYVLGSEYFDKYVMSASLVPHDLEMGTLVV